MRDAFRGHVTHNVKCYKSDAIITVGYRVSSKKDKENKHVPEKVHDKYIKTRLLLLFVKI